MIRKASFFLKYDTDNGTEILTKILKLPHVYMANITEKTINSNSIGTPQPTQPLNEIKGLAILHLGEVEILEGIFKGIADFKEIKIYPDKVDTFTKFKIMTGLTTGGLVFLSILLFISGDIFASLTLPSKIIIAILIAVVGFFIEMGIIWREHNS